MAIAALLFAGTGHAAEQPLLGGRTARFRAAGLRRRALVYFAGDAAALVTLGDPRCPARSIFRLTASVSRFTQVDLPCAKWRATSSHGYVYVDPPGSAGGVRRIVLVRGTLLVKLGGGNVPTITGPLPFAEAMLRVGTEQVCGRFASFEENTAGRSVAAPGSGPCHPRPNFIVVNLDDARADGIDRMPVVQSRIIGEGVRFTESFV